LVNRFESACLQSRGVGEHLDRLDRQRACQRDASLTRRWFNRLGRLLDNAA
jgi:hypothetical protein